MNAGANAAALSLSFHTVPELSPPEMARAAAEAGCRLVGVRLLNGLPGADPAPLLADAALRRATILVLRDLGLGVLEASGARLTPQTDMRAFEPFLDAAAELGARHVICSIDDPVEARAIAHFADICAQAGRVGLTVDIEFVSWMSVARLADAARLLRAARTAQGGIVVDALHFLRSGSTIADIAGSPPGWFRFMQICDARARVPIDRAALLHEAVRDRLFPGDGIIDLVALLRALPRGIPIAMEIPVSSALPPRERVLRAATATRRVLAAAYG